MNSGTLDKNVAAAKPKVPAVVIGLAGGVVMGALAFGLFYWIGDADIGMIFGAIAGVLVAALVSYMVASDRRYERQAADWQVVGEGTYDRVEYMTQGRDHRPTTVIHFDDGRAYILDQEGHIEFVRGSKIAIKRNGLGHYRVDVKK